MADREPDPVSDYADWAKNRYNPGHYLGGNRPPYLRHGAAPGVGKAMLLNALLTAGLTLVGVGWARGSASVILTGIAVVVIRLTYGLRRPLRAVSKR